MFSFQMFCGKNFSTYWPLHTVELNQTSTFKLIRIFYLFSLKNSFLAKNQNFKFQFQPLLTENGRDKNLAWQDRKGKWQKCASCVSLDAIRYSRTLFYLEILLK